MPMNGGIMPNNLNKPSTNNASAVKPKIIEITVASLLCFAIDSSSMRLASASASAIKVSTYSFVYVLRVFDILLNSFEKSETGNSLIIVSNIVMRVS